MPSEADWDIDHPGVTKELTPHQRRVIGLRHPSYPYVASWDDRDPEGIMAIAGRYLKRVGALFQLPPDLLQANLKFAERPSGLQMSWMPLEPHLTDANDVRDPRNSFWVRRYKNASTRNSLVDLTAIVLAMQSVERNKPRTAIGSKMAIRIVVQIFPEGGANAPWRAHISGATCSLALVDALRAGGPQTSEYVAPFVGANSAARTALKEQILNGAGLDPNTPACIDGLRILRVQGNRAELAIYGKVQKGAQRPHDPSYAFTARMRVGPGALDLQLRGPVKHILAAHAAPPIQNDLFPRDPASQRTALHLLESRPNASGRRLAGFRELLDLPGLQLLGGNRTRLREHPQRWIEVRRSRLVNRSDNEAQPEVVHLPSVTDPRRNDFAALSAYRQARILLDCMRNYGFAPDDYFRFSARPLIVRYRATMRRGSGKDGRTVNAEVDYDPLLLDIGDDPQNAVYAPLQVRFALADLKRTWSRREPLGLATDPRWSWHEYGHVLLAAATGALEMRFVHSAGDALAAIACDPHSRLARHGRLRFATYPWVYLNRRHDRSVWAGWSWSGKYHRADRFLTDPDVWPHRRKAYDSEQILSTTLFRVYRALGGDDLKANGKPFKDGRQRAADYALYLIMRAIYSLPPPNAEPVQSPEQFMQALMDADISTMPAAAGPLAGRVGGIAHKIIHWSFEQQGLFPPAGSDVHNAPGDPPAVDLYIDDRRPASHGPLPRGGYVPVSLDWHQWPNPQDWHAAAPAIQVAPDPNVPNTYQVTVGVSNRGPRAANNVRVRAWYAVWDGNGSPPAWNDAAWQPMGDLGPLNVGPAGQPPTQFGPFALPAAPANPQRYIIVAEASCADDLANSRSELPCATEPTPLVDMVAGDNNLALRVFP
jgi:hypothetical protein